MPKPKSKIALKPFPYKVYQSLNKMQRLKFCVAEELDRKYELPKRDNLNEVSTTILEQLRGTGAHGLVAAHLVSTVWSGSTVVLWEDKFMIHPPRLKQ